MKKQKFEIINTAIAHFTYEIVDKLLTEENIENTIVQNCLRDLDGKINSFRVYSEFNDNTLTITIGLLVHGRFFKIGEPKQMLYDLDDATKQDLLDFSATISSKVVKSLSYFARFNPESKDVDWIEDDRNMPNKIWTDIRISVNL